MMKRKTDEVQEFADFLKGYVAGLSHIASEGELRPLRDIEKWLRKLRNNMCGQGFIGCRGGDDCSSSHK